MRIVEPKNNNLVMLDSLNIGDVFRLDDTYCMLVSIPPPPFELSNNPLYDQLCVRMTNGILFWEPNDKMVCPINAKLVVE